jgi:hypothetical protein
MYRSWPLQRAGLARVRSTRRLRRVLPAALCSAGLLAVVACSSSGPASKPSPAPYEALINREDQLYPSFVECLARHDIPAWTKLTGSVQVAPLGIQQGWYRNGKVITNDAWYRWIDHNNGRYPLSPAFKPYQEIAQWVAAAAQHGTWPKICGPLPKA